MLAFGPALAHQQKANALEQVGGRMHSFGEEDIGEVVVFRPDEDGRVVAGARERSRFDCIVRGHGFLLSSL